MARYDYECPNCGHCFEIVRKMADPAGAVICPVCGTAAQRKFTAPPVHFHSDGFHHTDYGKGNYGIGTKADQLNKGWSKHWGEEPPPPAADVKRVSADPA